MVEQGSALVFCITDFANNADDVDKGHGFPRMMSMT
jgi:hypothetical protein